MHGPSLSRPGHICSTMRRAPGHKRGSPAMRGPIITRHCARRCELWHAGCAPMVTGQWRSSTTTPSSTAKSRTWQASAGSARTPTCCSQARAAGSFSVCVRVTTAPLPVHQQPVADGCGACRRCLDVCPTQAIIEPGVIDATRCLAWVLQKPGAIPIALRESVGDRIYGCDDCQEVCPPTVRFGPAIQAPVQARPRPGYRCSSC